MSPLSLLDCTRMSQVLTAALSTSVLSPDDTTLILLDRSFRTARIQALNQLFPSSTLHAVAVKANPLSKVLTDMVAHGNGLEVASRGELYQAEKAGCPPERIIYDSPAKTLADIEYALSKNIHINADSWSELERIATVVASKKLSPSIGIRVNPQVGVSTIGYTSTAGAYSKFGIPLSDYRDRIIQAFRRYDWLDTLHLHVGSQLADPQLIIDGVRIILDLALEIRRQNVSHLSTINIGGGFPVSYLRNHSQPKSIEAWVENLRTCCPEIFTEFRLVTEFGRFVHANAGWTASKVEYIKEQHGHRTAICHIGADMLVRESYRPNDWPHDIFVCDHHGRLKSGLSTQSQTIGGPLCFSGDILTTTHSLPQIDAGDYIIIADTGAYTFSMWSRYNTRQMPIVIEYDHANQFTVIKPRESLEQSVEIWG